MSYDIFLSYSRTDKALADQFMEAAKERGLTVWYDQLISGGQDWRNSIVEALRSSKSLVILFSEASNDSRQLIKELAIADNFSKLVIPVLIEDTEPRGPYLYEMASRNWINLYPNPSSRVESLIDRLAGQLGMQAAQAAPASYAAPAAGVKAPLFTGETAPRAGVTLPQSAKSPEPWFPLGRYDFFILMPLLVLAFILALREVHKAETFAAGLLSLYMLVIAWRNAALNRSIFSLKSFMSYVLLISAILTFVLIPDIVKTAAIKADAAYTTGYVIGVILVAIFFGLIFAIFANIFQFVLRRIFLRKAFQSSIRAIPAV
jgi:TIR domain